MEEFEKLEIELRSVYDDYLQKCRYLAYLEHLYEDAAKADQERFERRQVDAFTYFASTKSTFRPNFYIFVTFFDD